MNEPRSVRWRDPDARVIELEGQQWELLGEDRPCAVIDGVSWYWVCVAKSDRGHTHSGVMPIAPSAPIEELRPHLREVVLRARANRKGAFLAMEDPT